MSKTKRNHARAANWMVIGFAAIAGLLAGACKDPPKGACVVTYDGIYGEGEACTMSTDEACVDGMQPRIADLAGTPKRKSFQEGALCEQIGFKRSGCPKVPLAWSFQDKCLGEQLADDMKQ